jgi:hypothetical protein
MNVVVSELIAYLCLPYIICKILYVFIMNRVLFESGAIFEK